jgi:hypothetical protein
MVYAKSSRVNVQIRGNSSISADNKVLIIIDGAVVTNEIYNKSKSSWTLKIDVLKAADATAIYGSTGCKWSNNYFNKRWR